MKKTIFLFFLSFLIVGFGQPAWSILLSLFSAAVGYALFWKGMLFFPSLKTRFFISMSWFTLVQAVQLSWLATPDYMGPFIFLVYFIVILAMGAQFGCISLLVDSLLFWPKMFALAGGWVLFEWLRLFVACGFTWNPVGLTLGASSYAVQFASLFGIFGLSFWVIFTNLTALRVSSFPRFCIWAFFVLCPYAFGLIQETWIRKVIPVEKNLEIALIQTNLAPEQKEFSSDFPTAYVSPLQQWEKILTSMQKKKVDLIVFPEVAFPLGAFTHSYPFSFLQKHFELSSFASLALPHAIFEGGDWKVSNSFLLQTLANQTNAHVISGLDDRDFYGHYNAAFHFQPQAFQAERYIKQILVPVGEYVPLKQWRRFAKFLAKKFGIYSSFEHGKEGKIFHGHVPMGISICIEETFASLMRQLRLKGAKLFISLINDAWFPHSKLASQHFEHGKIRSVENGVPLLRACNSGISSGIDCFGRPIGGFKTKEEEGVAYFSFPIRSYPTLYTYLGDLPILLISLTALGSYFFRMKKKLL